jgi:hypothetical protein
METRSIVAHNINERGCAMMVLGCFYAEVIATGVEPYGLGWWCLFRVGSGD